MTLATIERQITLLEAAIGPSTRTPHDHPLRLYCDGDGEPDAAWLSACAACTGCQRPAAFRVAMWPPDAWDGV